MAEVQILFVDDEPSIRVTLPAILEANGYKVTVAESVPEALAFISSRPFDLLLSDLNIGQPGDGFIVVSAMRRTHPDCVNLILTGYPQFETALQAIRNQVDDYLTKPAQVSDLLSAIEKGIKNRKSPDHRPMKRVAAVLRQRTNEVTQKALRKMKANSDVTPLSMPDRERVDHIPLLLVRIADQLDSNEPDLSSFAKSEAAAHGTLRHRQGYSAPMLVEDARLIDEAIFDTIQEQLMTLDLSTLISDLRHVNRILELQLKESLRAYLEVGKAAA